MNKSSQSSRYLLWPIFILLFLTIGVFLTTNEIPKQHDVRSRAQVFQNPSLFPTGFADEVETPSPTHATTVTIEPVNADISISFSLPGIASQGGNLIPLHKTRTILLKFFDPDNNSEAKNVEPLFIIKSTVLFDEDPKSATYTKFVQKDINLKKLCQETSQCVPRGKYQIALKTYQALQKVSKDNKKKVGGKVYEIFSNTKLTVPFDALVFGDIAPPPDGDNLVDRADLDAFSACFGDKLESADCLNKQSADFDDNGVVDGYDYNLLVRSLAIIQSQGGTIPSFNATQKVTIQKKAVSPRPSAAPLQNKQKQTGNLILPIIMVLVLIAGIIFALRSKKVKALLHRSNVADKEYFIKKEHEDPGQPGIWLTLADDDGFKIGHYHETIDKEGFAHIKGVEKKENGKKFIEISEILWEK